MHMWGCLWAMTHVHKESEDNLQESGLSFHYMDMNVETQFIRLDSKCFIQLTTL